MTDMQIRYLLSVADTGSFTEAAKRNHVSQPTISASVRQLESELGFSVFVRLNRGISVTACGQEFLDWLRLAEANYTKTLERVRHMAKAEQMSLSIGALSYHYSPALYHAVSLFQKQYPDIRISIDVLPPQELLDNIGTGKHDIILCSPDLVENNKALSLTIIGKLHWVIIYAETSPYAQLQNPKLSDFSDAVFIGPGNITTGANALRQLNSKIFNNPNAIFPHLKIAVNTESAIAEIESGLGIGFCPSSYMLTAKTNLCMFPTEIVTNYCVAANKSKSSELIDAFVKALTQCASETEVSCP